MNKLVLPAMIIAGVFVIAGGVYLATPSLQSSAAVAETEVAEATERARRLLTQFGENEERLDMVINSLRLSGVDDSNTELLSELAETDREMFTEAEERLREVVQEQQARMQQLLSESRAAQSIAPPAPRSSFGTNLPQLTEAIQSGLKARDALMARNEQILADALSAVNEGLAKLDGTEIGSSHALALNVKGMIEYQQGIAAYRQARALRDRTHGPRGGLQILAAAIEKENIQKDIVSRSGIDEKIAQVGEALTKQQEQVKTFDQQIANLDSQISQMQTTLQQQQTIAEQARSELDALAGRGAELDKPDGYERFAVQYGAQSKVYRDALKQIQILEFGTLANATIGASGNYVSGEYVPADGSGQIEPHRGLYHLRAELDALKHQREDAHAVVASLDEQVETMNRDKASLTAAGTLARSRAGETATSAAELFDQVRGIIAQAHELEEQAVAKLTASAQSFDNAARQSQTLQGRYSQETSGLSPQAQERSAKTLFANDVRPPASLTARAADARLRLAMLYFDRYHDLQMDQTIVERLAGHVPELPDAQELATDTEAARTAGLAMAEQGTETLLRVARELEQHYSVTAEIAAGYYLQSLFGKPELVEVAIRNYQAVIEGREDDPLVQPYVERLAQLRSRKP